MYLTIFKFLFFSFSLVRAQSQTYQVINYSPLFTTYYESYFSCAGLGSTHALYSIGNGCIGGHYQIGIDVVPTGSSNFITASINGQTVGQCGLKGFSCSGSMSGYAPCIQFTSLDNLINTSAGQIYLRLSAASGACGYVSGLSTNVYMNARVIVRCNSYIAPSISLPSYSPTMLSGFTSRTYLSAYNAEQCSYGISTSTLWDTCPTSRNEQIFQCNGSGCSVTRTISFIGSCPQQTYVDVYVIPTDYSTFFPSESLTVVISGNSAKRVICNSMGDRVTTPNYYTGECLKLWDISNIVSGRSSVTIELSISSSVNLYPISGTNDRYLDALVSLYCTASTQSIVVSGGGSISPVSTINISGIAAAVVTWIILCTVLPCIVCCLCIIGIYVAACQPKRRTTKIIQATAAHVTTAHVTTGQQPTSVATSGYNPQQQQPGYALQQQQPGYAPQQQQTGYAPQPSYAPQSGYPSQNQNVYGEAPPPYNANHTNY